MQRSLSVLAVALFASLVVAEAGSAALVQYWTLDDGAGTTAANEIGTGNTGVLVNGPVWITTGLAPQLTSRGFMPSTAALDFIPSDPDYVNGGNVGLSATGSGGQVTLSMWLRPDASSSDMRVYSQLSGSTGNGGATRLNSGALEMWNGGAWLSLLTAVPTGVWSHVALTWTNDAVQAYLNGIATGSVTSDFDFAADDFGIGARFTNLFGTGFEGAIDDVALWDEALSPAAIALLAAGQPLIAAPAVPEPSTFAVLALGAIGLLATRRKTRRG